MMTTRTWSLCSDLDGVGTAMITSRVMSVPSSAHPRRVANPSRSPRQADFADPLGTALPAASPCPGPAGTRGSKAGAAGPAGTRSALDAWGAGPYQRPAADPLGKPAPIGNQLHRAAGPHGLRLPGRGGDLGEPAAPVGQPVHAGVAAGAERDRVGPAAVEAEQDRRVRAGDLAQLSEHPGHRGGKSRRLAGGEADRAGARVGDQRPGRAGLGVPALGVPPLGHRLRAGVGHEMVVDDLDRVTGEGRWRAWRWRRRAAAPTDRTPRPARTAARAGCAASGSRPAPPPRRPRPGAGAWSPPPCRRPARRPAWRWSAPAPAATPRAGRRSRTGRPRRAGTRCRPRRTPARCPAEPA